MQEFGGQLIEKEEQDKTSSQNNVGEVKLRYSRINFAII
ncbi:hypothetical protein SSU98_0888 [Streptococcus suis 98HAH33]|nr:hypothetical protein SSU98_0888 [Streptococcus suis 98HAH33]